MTATIEAIEAAIKLTTVVFFRPYLYVIGKWIICKVYIINNEQLLDDI
jgi:hypothetical protein